jgi:hypothetical protein
MTLPLCLILIAAAAPLSAADFSVAPSGDDAGPGSLARPFATLERARDAVRAARRRNPNRDYSVALRGGTYRLARTLVFSLEDSAAPGRTVTWAAHPGETPVISSGLPVSGWRREGKFWVADLPPSVTPFRTLYDASGRLPRARSAPFSPTRDYRTAAELDRFTLPFPAGAVRNWPNLPDVDLMIRPNYGWVLNPLPLESVDEKSGMARTAIPASYPMIRIRWGLRDVNSRGTAWIENTLDALDEPGEWVLDSRARKLWLWPRGDRPEAVEAPQLTELVRVEGQIDFDGPRDRPARGLVFRGLSFTRADRWPWEKERIGSTLQHDWDHYDRPTAMLRVRGAEDVTIERCRFFESGGGAVRADLHAQRIRVTDSVVEHIGGTGVLLAGYGPGAKDVNHHNEILRNHIHHVGEILWHSPAVYCWQSGENRVAWNLVHDTNYTAIMVSGRISWNREGRGDGWRTIRWQEVEAAAGQAAMPAAGKRVEWSVRERFLHGRNNIVERNEIHDVMQKLWDGNGIYVSGTGRGNRVRENFIHDSMSENMCEAIRCDDDQHDTWIQRNVLLRNGGMGTGIAIKGINHVLNNFVIDPAWAFQPRGAISIEGIPVDGAMIQRNVVWASKPGLRPFFAKNTIGPPEPDPRLGDTRTDFNLYWHTTDAKWAEPHFSVARAEGAEQHSLFADPLLVDPDQGDCRFRPGSPAAKLGIQPVDLRRVGLRKSPPVLSGREPARSAVEYRGR